MISNFKFQFLFLVLLLVAQGSLRTVDAQRRDHLTAMEVEIVRDAQQIDRRMEIFVKAIDRRFLVVNNDASQAKQIQKDIDKWGELPAGTRLEIFLDIEKILEEAISKIDDVASHDMKNELFPIAVHILADGANRFLPPLNAQLKKATDAKEKGAIIGAIDSCQQIIEASAKVSKLTPKETKKIRSKNKQF